MDDFFNRIKDLSPTKRMLLARRLARAADKPASRSALSAKRLVAYVAVKEGVTNDSDEMRRFLSGKLPEHMTPSAFVFLDALPLTPNGKIDRRLLAGLDPVKPESRSYAAPRNEIEEAVCGIWQEEMALEKIGVHDNFFELGGHSLLATRILYLVKKLFKVDLPVREIFEAATVARLSEQIVANEPRPGQTEKTARALKKIKSMSPDERELLRKKRARVSPS